MMRHCGQCTGYYDPDKVSEICPHVKRLDQQDCQILSPELIKKAEFEKLNGSHQSMPRTYVITMTLDMIGTAEQGEALLEKMKKELALQKFKFKILNASHF